MSDSNKKPEVDFRLKNLTNALYLTESDDVALRTGITGDIIIEGSVSIPGEVTVNSTPEDPVHTHISEVGTSGIISTPYLPVGGTVALDSATLTALENTTVTVGNFPATQQIAGTVTANQGTTPWVVSGTLTAVNVFDPGSVDAFGRQRVSEPYTLGDYSHTYGEEAELLTLTDGAPSSTTTPIPNQAAIRLSVGTNNGAYVRHQSRMYHHYMPGKSQHSLMSFVFGTHRTNTHKRIGLFGNTSGIFFQQKGDGSLCFVFRSDVTGAIVDTEVPQAEWNIDTCDTGIVGTGVLPDGSDAVNSGQAGSWTLDVTKAQLLYIDYQWLGVGRVRVGFVHDGHAKIVHEFYHSNYMSTVYWSNPSLPVRCEILNVGTAVGTASMDQMCATVISEGGYKESGVDFSADSSAIALAKGAPGAYKVCMAIRLKDTYQGLRNRSIVRLIGMDMFADSASCQWELWRLPGDSNITGGTWVSAGDDSVVEYNTTAGTSFNTTDGNRMNSGWIAANNPSGKQASGSSAIADPSASKRAYISQNIDSTESNMFVLIVRDLSPTADTNLYAAMQWRETR